MDDTISRSALQKEFDEKCIHDCEFCPFYLQWITEDLEREGTCVLIQKSAALDVAPVVHAHWIHCKGKSNLWYCSECGDKILYNPTRKTYNITKLSVSEKNKFCRNCGAKMDGESNGSLD